MHQLTIFTYYSGGNERELEMKMREWDTDYGRYRRNTGCISVKRVKRMFEEKRKREVTWIEKKDFYQHTASMFLEYTIAVGYIPYPSVRT